MSLIILAGGNSTRVNSKPFLKLGDKTLIEIIINKINNIFNEIIIVTNEIEKYNSTNSIKNNLRIKVMSDIIKNKGPLSGIYSGLTFSKESYNFVLACDMPFVNINLIKYMKDITGFDAVVPKNNGYIEPLCAVYSKSCLPIIKNQLEKNELKIKKFIDKITVKYVGEDVIEKFDKGLCFFNVNTGEDFDEAKELYKNAQKN